MTQEAFKPLAPTDTFRFSCSATVPCFNDCCRDLNQFLTPYDILRIKSGLGLASDLFLRRYTTTHTGPETGLPVIAFKTTPEKMHKCPFVSQSGCRIYENRPSSCRMYPLVRAVSRSRATGCVTEHFGLLQEPHCLGHFQQRTQTVAAWIEAQGLRSYLFYNDLLLTLIHRKNAMKPGPLEADERRRIHLALYNLDAFRTLAFENGFFKKLSIDSAIYAQARQKDSALLKVGINWLEKTVFSR